MPHKETKEFTDAERKFGERMSDSKGIQILYRCERCGELFEPPEKSDTDICPKCISRFYGIGSGIVPSPCNNCKKRIAALKCKAYKRIPDAILKGGKCKFFSSS